jgi:hypothetical protein
VIEVCWVLVMWFGCGLTFPNLVSEDSNLGERKVGLRLK